MKTIRLISYLTELDVRVNVSTICAYWPINISNNISNNKFGTRILFTNGQTQDYIQSPEVVDKLIEYKQ